MMDVASVVAMVNFLNYGSKLMQNLTETVSGYVKDSAADAVKARDELKVVIDDAVSLNTEYAGKAYDSGVETVKKAAGKKAS